MFAPVLRRSFVSTFRVARPVARNFSIASVRFNGKVANKTAYTLEEVNGPESLIPPGPKEGEIGTDLEQATGLDRLEYLGQLEGINIFDQRPLDASRKGTVADPIMVDSYDDYRYVGCTGSPAGSHEVLWLKPSVEKKARCWECGSVYAINPLGVPGEGGHHH